MVTTKTADRYLRTGTSDDDPPKIYPGDLRGINQALREASEKSADAPGKHVLEAVYDGVRFPFRIYENGDCIWQEQQPT